MIILLERLTVETSEFALPVKSKVQLIIHKNSLKIAKIFIFTILFLSTKKLQVFRNKNLYNHHLLAKEETDISEDIDMSEEIDELSSSSNILSNLSAATSLVTTSCKDKRRDLLLASVVSTSDFYQKTST